MKCILAVTALLLPTVVAKPASYFEYTTVTGYFEQDDPATNPTGYDYAEHNFGLINQTYDTDRYTDLFKTKSPWQRFAAKVDSLNRRSDRDTSYKLLFMGRHGEGYHNVAESYYGTPAWNCYWSIRDGNGTVRWDDALITPNGVAQAQKANAFWAKLIKEQKIHTPDSFYSSPLTRCLSTANITFAGLRLQHRFVPEVSEFLREGISGHTCDRRQSKTYIQKSFPRYRIEKGFTENDELFRPLLQEPGPNQDVRSKTVLDEIFDEDKGTWLSITSHSGEIRSILRVLKHREFSLGTGQVIPVLVEAKRKKGTAPPTTTQEWTPISTCAEPPALPTASG